MDPQLPPDLEERLQTAGLLEGFRSMPVELQHDFIGFVEASKDHEHRKGRIDMLETLIRRALVLWVTCDLPVLRSALQLKKAIGA